MKTTLVIDDEVMTLLKREAVRRKRTMSELVEAALRSMLRSEKPSGKLRALPRFDGGGALVDVADRDALFEVMRRR